MTAPLVESPEANKFRANAKLASWHKVWFGDPAKMPKEVHGYMKRASDALHAGLAKVDGLADDPTKTTVVRHETAKKVAENTIAAILDAKGRQEAAGHAMMAEANDAINEAFPFDTNRSHIYERIINWINSNSSEHAKIREAMRQDPQIVTVLSNYPPYVFDISQGACRTIATEGWTHHAPEAAEKLLSGQRVIDAAKGYDRAVKGIRASFYNETVAAQAAKRVDA